MITYEIAPCCPEVKVPSVRLYVPIAGPVPATRSLPKIDVAFVTLIVPPLFGLNVPSTAPFGEMTSFCEFTLYLSPFGAVILLPSLLISEAPMSICRRLSPAVALTVALAASTAAVIATVSFLDNASK